ncbi:hypothetical protein [Anaeromyxobacter paludicola]|uniref:Cytochrome b561 domain-containing protein n=1 Tax=Anaeromyxobacter paludicola TaxID=2918171 RepID=A0ABN6N9T1_9BACT|nr:hypothetical protein [Anaeromyxobacter paludicola]BDG10002.1 hypothetical protein AMPC_31150 [Anaeromyxobacter paludicola]
MIAASFAAAMLVAQFPSGPEPHLLDGPLRPPVLLALSAPAPGGSPLLLRVSEAEPPQGGAGGSGEQGAPGEGAKPPSPPPRPPGARPAPGTLDFDLLGAPQQREKVDEHALRLRRTLLTWHQGVGLGMFALQLATTAVGQLNYGDKFGGDNTGKYVQPHAILAAGTLAAFAATGALALFAPSPVRRDEGFDRVSLHKYAMLVATVGMVAQGVLGVWTQSREGYLNQQSIGTAHLAIGYVTLAAVAAGVSALVF